MKNLLLGLAVASASLSVVGQAAAADLPIKTPSVAYNPCGPVRFNGGYVGGNVGANAYTAHRSDLDGFLTDNSGWTATDVAPTAGVQAGYDWQFCNKLFGLVADLNWTNAKANTFDNPNAPPGDNAIRSQMKWFSTIRGRAGLAVNDALFYATGGVAAARIETTITDANTFGFEKTRWGLVGGVGAEFALWSNWSLNAEVLYMHFAKQNVNFISGGDLFSFDLNDSAWITRVGLNYRWNNPQTSRAAAMPVKSVAPAHPCGPGRFNGGYVGGNVGGNAYTAHRSDLDGFLTDNAGWTATDIAPTAGVQAGYDWQSCNKVFGLVADLNWTNAKANTFDNPNAPPGDNAIRSQMSWFGTVRGRAGMTMSDALVYVTGGVAAARIETAITDTNTFGFEKTRWGLAGGAGAEFALGHNWSVNTEVLYMHFAKQHVIFGAGPFGFDFNDTALVGRVGVNYRWGGVGPATTKN